MRGEKRGEASAGSQGANNHESCRPTPTESQVFPGTFSTISSPVWSLQTVAAESSMHIPASSAALCMWARVKGSPRAAPCLQEGTDPPPRGPWTTQQTRRPGSRPRSCRLPPPGFEVSQILQNTTLMRGEGDSESPAVQSFRKFEGCSVIRSPLPPSCVTLSKLLNVSLTSCASVFPTVSQDLYKPLERRVDGETRRSYPCTHSHTQQDSGGARQQVLVAAVICKDRFVLHDGPQPEGSP